MGILSTQSVIPGGQRCFGPAAAGAGAGSTARAGPDRQLWRSLVSLLWPAAPKAYIQALVDSDTGYPRRTGGGAGGASAEAVFVRGWWEGTLILEDPASPFIKVSLCVGDVGPAEGWSRVRFF